MTLEKLAGITMRAFADAETKVNTRFDIVDKRFESIDKRFESIDKRFDDFEIRVNARFDGVERRLDHHASYYVTYPEHFKLTKRLEKLEKRKI